MERKTKITNIVVIALAVTVVFMSIGFAAFAQQLDITGTATVKKAEWKVEFDTDARATTINPQGIQPTTSNVQATNYEFAVALNRPKDFFEVELTVANHGTIDALLTGVSMDAKNSEDANEDVSKYLDYTLTYDDGVNEPQVFTDDTSLTSNPISLPGDNAAATVTIRVEYKLPGQSSDLPATDKTINITGALNYSSVD